MFHFHNSRYKKGTNSQSIFHSINLEDIDEYINHSEIKAIKAPQYLKNSTTINVPIARGHKISSL